MGLNPNQKMSDQLFEQFSAFISSRLGIKMPETKKTMLQGRLMKRLRELDLASYEPYFDFVFSPKGQAEEMIHLLDVVTTNKTDFFREPNHFQIMRNMVLPKLVRHRKIGK